MVLWTADLHQQLMSTFHRLLALYHSTLRLKPAVDVSRPLSRSFCHRSSSSKLYSVKCMVSRCGAAACHTISYSTCAQDQVPEDRVAILGLKAHPVTFQVLHAQVSRLLTSQYTIADTEVDDAYLLRLSNVSTTF